MVQTVQLIIEISPVAVLLVVDVLGVQLQGPQVQFCGGGRPLCSCSDEVQLG